MLRFKPNIRYNGETQKLLLDSNYEVNGLFHCSVITTLGHYVQKKKNHSGTFSIPLEVIGIQMKDSFGVYSKSCRRADPRHSAIHLFF